MAVQYLKKASKTAASGEDETRRIVAEMLAEIESGGEDSARDYSEKLDGYTGEILVGEETIAATAEKVPNRLK
ncbi:MAG: histidinol dehydrogenase, partial [Alphaproteobacteria bacterium]|nr:histidinol dehydrogenase [Alphaproteobacteria bacterium]